MQVRHILESIFGLGKIVFVTPSQKRLIMECLYEVDTIEEADERNSYRYER